MVFSQFSELPKIELAPLSISLPEWEVEDFSAFNRSVEEFQTLTHDVGIGSGYFFQVCERLESAVFEKNIQNLNGYIRTSLDVRALTYLLATSEAFAKKAVLSSSLIKKIEAVRDPVSTWALDFLVKAYLNHYDYLAKGETLTLLGQFIVKHLFFYQLKRREVTFRRLYKHREVLFEPDSLKRVNNELSQPKVRNLAQLAKRWGVLDYLEGRYFKVCQFQTYLVQLQELDIGESHAVFADLSQEDVYNMVFDGDRLLGHEVIEQLVTRCQDRPDMPTQWRNLVLAIAGDPRQNVKPQAQNLWQGISIESLNKMNQWMIRYDVELFSQLLFDGQEVSDPIERRNHPMVCRQTFVEGLLDCGLIRESRLLISQSGLEVLKTQFELEHLPHFMKVTGKASVIYLNVDGKVHCLEGSGAFKLKLFDKVPEAFDKTYQTKTSFAAKNLGNQLATQYYQQYGYDGGFQEYAHDQGLHWQHQCLSYLRQNAVRFHPEDALTKAKYSEFKQRFGHQLYRYKKAKRLKVEDENLDAVVIGSVDGVDG